MFMGEEAGVPTIKSWFCIDLLLSDPYTENETSKNRSSSSLYTHVYSLVDWWTFIHSMYLW